MIMKQLFFLLAFLSVNVISMAQSEKYSKAMAANISKMDTLQSPSQWLELSNTFERIANAEKEQWLPYYYAAYSALNNAFLEGNNSGSYSAEKSDPAADRAEMLISKAAEIGGENAEIYILKKMVANLRLMVDPMNRYATYGQAGADALGKAKQLDPSNPRVYLLEGQDKFFTPEQFGGSKPEAKILFETAINKYQEFKPASSLHPSWGLNQAKYFYDQCK